MVKFFFLLINFILFSSLSYGESIKAASINLCADQYLYLIADRKQITSLSYMSKDENISFISNRVEHFNLNNGRAEEIILQKPDVVFVGPGSSQSTIKILKKLDFNIVKINKAKNFEEVKKQVLLISKIMGNIEKGEKINNNIDIEINKYLKNFQRKNDISLVVLAPNGYAFGKDSLVSHAVDLLGYRSVIRKLNVIDYNRIDLESLLLLDPEIIILADSYKRYYSLSQDFLNHNVLNYLIKKGRKYDLSKNLLSCSGPFSTNIIRELIMQDGK